ncbi:hypothetical protein NGB36_26425 [Streptomyces sp. RB6PN25]|uniref:Uncharacterized protein n=1 Tax=Streptomyces humicola TaxID=2953240 RepID=A0ABT1Q5I9_9ACTN|nr:hypothetical protein [Streptomyces humicola]MCQ4084022.1 hypothetical protein [Streptomyces humicola]
MLYLLAEEFLGAEFETITKAVGEVRPLLEQHGHHITASTARFHTPADVIAFLVPVTPNPHQTKIKSAC